MTRLVRPVLKWAGGKSRSLPHILAALPDEIDTYYEPFIGGAAVFFALAGEKRFKKAVLGDRNRALIDMYRGLKKDPEGIIKVLGTYVHDQDAVLPDTEPRPEDARHERASRPDHLPEQDRVQRPLSRQQPRRVQRPLRALQETELLRRRGPPCRITRALAGDPRRGRLRQGEQGREGRRDGVYFDPPYDPVSKTANFTAYHHEEFGKENHERLKDAFDRLAARGVAVVLLNSDTEFTNDFFEHWKPKKINVSRPINSKATHRGNVRELLVVSPHRK